MRRRIQAILTVLILGWCSETKAQPPNHAVKQHRGILASLRTVKPRPLRMQLTLKENGKERILKVARWTLVYDSKEKNPSLKIADVVEDSNRYRNYVQRVGEERAESYRGTKAQETFARDEEQRQERYGTRLKLRQLRSGQEVIIFSDDEKNDALLILLAAPPGKPSPLETERMALAKLRLIEQLISAGQREKARLRLEEFQKTYGETTAAAKAKKLMDSLR